MKNKTILFLSIVALIIVSICAYSYGVRHEKKLSSTIISPEMRPLKWPVAIDAESKLTKYSSQDLGFSFSYPLTWGTPVLTISKGTMGEIFNLKFPNKDTIFVSGATKDYVPDTRGQEISDPFEDYYTKIAKGIIPQSNRMISHALFPIDGGVWIIPVTKNYQAQGFVSNEYIAVFKLNSKYAAVNFSYNDDGSNDTADILYLVDTVTFE